MAERPTTSDLEAWRVADLADGFADRVLARLDETMLLDEDPFDDRERVAPVRALPRPRRTGIVALACAVAAAGLLLWVLRPDPPAPPPLRQSVSIGVPVQSAPRRLDHAAIQRAIDEHLRGRAELCYAALMTNATPTSGQLIIDVEVVRRNGRGVVTRAAIDPISELDDAPFRDCLLRAARAMLFDAPSDDTPVQIELPIEFRDPWVYEPAP